MQYLCIGVHVHVSTIMQYLCIVHVYVCTRMHDAAIRVYLRTCRYAATHVNRPSGVSQAAAITVNLTQGDLSKTNFPDQQYVIFSRSDSLGKERKNTNKSKEFPPNLDLF